MTKNKLISALLFLLALVIALYIASPYYSAWKMMQAVKTGSVENMQYYIDFPKVNASIKQQISTAINKESSNNPIGAQIAKSLQPLFDKVIDELMQAEKLAEFIQTQKLSHTKKLTTKDNTNPASSTTSWQSSFKHFNHFTVTADKLALHMQLQNWRWQVTAIGVDELIDFNHSQRIHLKTAKNKAPVADKIDTTAQIPTITADLKTLTEDLKTAFFIESDFREHAQIEGDFHYFSGAQTLKPSVTWIEARDVDNNPMLGEFSDEKLAERKKFNIGNQYYLNKWSDKLPKKSAANLASVTGKVTVDVPTSMIQYSLDRSSLNQMIIKQNTAVKLSELENGNISLSYYSPFDGKKTTPVIITRNAKGQALQQPNNVSMTPTEAINDPQFAQAMRGTDKSITISGTPHTVEVYFPANHKTISNTFIATPKPEASFGELKTPITHTRYTAPLSEPELPQITAQQLQDSPVGFFEETTYDKKKKRFLQITLPQFVYNKFAKVNFNDLTISQNNQALEFRLDRSTLNNHQYRAYFLEDTQQWSDDSVVFDQIKGSITLKYPKTIRKFTVQQGETKNNAQLDGSTLKYPKNSNIPLYYGHGDVRSIIAYGDRNRQIAYLADAGFGHKEHNGALFWGEPNYVEIKEVTEWITVTLPIDLSIDDLKIEKSPYQ